MCSERHKILEVTQLKNSGYVELWLDDNFLRLKPVEIGSVL